ncbi:trans-aconitate 2-methyltransferase [Desulfovibrio sp.]|uniref:class I SAM-dependent methyltransferase n=1 Tax=Desulfovibrio sp. TaxID=885 RepID=UPI0035AEE77B
MDWNAGLYDQQHDFVAAYGENLLGLLPDGLGFAVDLGCGTGALTGPLTARAARVVGIDASPHMIAQARLRLPQVEFMVMDACDMPWSGSVDAIFSNAALHWIEDQERLTATMARVLRPGGLLVCEFGARGNIGRLRAAFAAAFQAALAGEGLGPAYLNSERFYFPSAAEYAALLARHGFSVRQAEEYDRPTPLKGGNEGLASWMGQFFAQDLDCVPPAAQEKIFAAVADALRASLWDGGQWIADYRRLRVVAVKH